MNIICVFFFTLDCQIIQYHDVVWLNIAHHGHQARVHILQQLLDRECLEVQPYQEQVKILLQLRLQTDRIDQFFILGVCVPPIVVLSVFDPSSASLSAHIFAPHILDIDLTLLVDVFMDFFVHILPDCDRFIVLEGEDSPLALFEK